MTARVTRQVTLIAKKDISTTVASKDVENRIMGLSPWDDWQTCLVCYSIR